MNLGQVLLGEKQASSLLEVLQERWDGGEVLLTQQGSYLIYADTSHTFEITAEGKVSET